MSARKMRARRVNHNTVISLMLVVLTVAYLMFLGDATCPK